uniref:NRDE protein-domain-containing protein n=1 Tax=Panagrellus redivivus TaxID=6233 RepID=A0A7E4VH08_PANRE
MCVTFLYTRAPGVTNTPWKLIILNSRDEVLARKTSGAAWENGILAGRDEEAPDRGTWFGVNRSGKAGILLSITEPKAAKNPQAPSRGAIVTDYLHSPVGLDAFTANLVTASTQYNGFQFVGIEPSKDSFRVRSIAHKYVSVVEPLEWEYGIHGFGNSPPSMPYKKVTHGVDLFEKAVRAARNEKELVEGLFSVATDTTSCAPDHQLELQTGLDGAHCEFLTSLFVKEHLGYGTRSHSIYLVSDSNEAVFIEKRLTSEGSNIDGVWETTEFRFNLS